MTHEEPSVGERPPDPWPGRRQLYELTGEELRAQRAWWFPGPDVHLWGPDAATVMPIDTSGAAPDGSAGFPPGRYLLHAVFTLADDTHLDGHVTFEPGDGGTIADREPTICAPRGQVPLWLGALPATGEQLRAWLAVLDRSRAAIFPLRWEASLHPPDRSLAGTLQGFAALRDGHVAWV